MAPLRQSNFAPIYSWPPNNQRRSRPVEPGGAGLAQLIADQLRTVFKGCRYAQLSTKWQDLDQGGHVTAQGE